MFNITIISVYAPTEDGDIDEKDRLYEELQNILDNTQRHNITLILDDMNAKVGRENCFISIVGEEY